MHDPFDFPALFVKEDDAYVITFPDVPEAITQGENWEDAVYMAQDALRITLDAYIYDWNDLPKPSTPTSEHTMISLPYLVKAKLAVYQHMKENGISKSELCSKLHCDLVQVSNILDLYENTDLSLIESALSVLGKRFALTLIEV